MHPWFNTTSSETTVLLLVRRRRQPWRHSIWSWSIDKNTAFQEPKVPDIGSVSVLCLKRGITHTSPSECWCLFRSACTYIVNFLDTHQEGTCFLCILFRYGFLWTLKLYSWLVSCIIKLVRKGGKGPAFPRPLLLGEDRRSAGAVKPPWHIRVARGRSVLRLYITSH